MKITSYRRKNVGFVIFFDYGYACHNMLIFMTAMKPEGSESFLTHFFSQKNLFNWSGVHTVHCHLLQVFILDSTVVQHPCVMK